jgi:hypothetical protein
MRKSVKRLVASRASYRCEYCFSPLDFSPDPFSIDHIDPQGGDDSDNLAFSCQGCNNYKWIMCVIILVFWTVTIGEFHPLLLSKGHH